MSWVSRDRPNPTWILLSLALACCFWWLAIAPVAAAPLPPSPELVPLTLARLSDRLQHPQIIDGARVVDLRRFVIDLRPEAGEFRSQFYTTLHSQLQRQVEPLGLDLSYAVIQGDLDLHQLGLRTPLYGAALDPIFSPAEQAQLDRDRRRLSQLNQLSRSLLIQAPSRSLDLAVFRGLLKMVQTQVQGTVNGASTFFLGRWDAQGAQFGRSVTLSDARFSGSVNFSGAQFRQGVQFRNSIFFQAARFTQSHFQDSALWSGCEFQGTASFNRAVFDQAADFSRSRWQGNADFARAIWHGPADFSRTIYVQALFLTDAVLEQGINLREAEFNQPANWRGLRLAQTADLGDSSFAQTAYLNISGLTFNPDRAAILGNAGQIARVLSVPTLQGNETLLRNLVRNFRHLDQFTDANQIEYLTTYLRQHDLQQRLLGINLNQASAPQLAQAGLTPPQIQAVRDRRTTQRFTSVAELLKLEAVDLATYIKVRDRLTAGDPLTFSTRSLTMLRWLGLTGLIWLSRYGTSFGLTFGVGLLALAYFSLLFWLVDRVRQRPLTIDITLPESIWVLSSSVLLGLSGLAAILRSSDRPLYTLLGLGILVVPIPAGLISQHYRHPPPANPRSYFVEDSSSRQLRILIGRLPIMPRFTPFFRDRYQPILWERAWGWLNYFDLSLNNLFKFGFNDIRLRDEQMPGWVTALVWYQWALGLLYFTLLLWTLSRTIPGLNVLLYFK